MFVFSLLFWRMNSLRSDILYFFVNYLQMFVPKPKHTSISTCAALCCLHLDHSSRLILNLIPIPTPPPPEGESYSASAVFPSVCTMRAVGFGDRSEGSGWMRPHEAVDCVDSVAYPEAHQQPLKRGARETDRAPGNDLLPCSPPLRRERSRPSQLSSESSRSPAERILLACILDYLPAARAPVCSDVAFLEPNQTCESVQSHQRGR